jgi:putative restriction endonuclease
LHDAGLHRPLVAGISGSETDGADSIVLSGGYEDDEDSGDVIIYTGQGGNDARTGRQIADQELRRGNLALFKSCERSLPVRVIRGAGAGSAQSPTSGLRYDGLYLVSRTWSQVGRSGHLIWRFRLVREDSK